MPLRSPRGARRYNDRITLTWAETAADGFAHPDVAEPVPVLDVWAEVRQMSATKTMLSFQQADVVGVDLEFRLPAVRWNGIRWRGHEINFPRAEVLDNRGRIVRVSGWYQADNPGVSNG